ncbi:MAG: helix-turn-helix transcriptional regulator [Bacilli bacterium]|nr:helix-turn-helix transcriptional regulator [Bacilli bacterium]
MVNIKFDRKDENYVYSFIGKNVKKYRREKGLTQKKLAELTTYSKQFISNIENNVHQTFSIGTLWRIALVLEVDMYKLCIEPKETKEEVYH